MLNSKHRQYANVYTPYAECLLVSQSIHLTVNWALAFWHTCIAQRGNTMGWWGRNTIASTDTILACAMMNEEWIILPFPGKLWLYRVSTALQMLQIETVYYSVCVSLRKWQERSHKNRTWSYNGEYNIVFLWLVVVGRGLRRSLQPIHYI